MLMDLLINTIKTLGDLSLRKEKLKRRISKKEYIQNQKMLIIIAIIRLIQKILVKLFLDKSTQMKKIQIKT